MGNRNVIALFGHRAARARNQTHFRRIRYICDATTRNGRVYLCICAPGSALSAEWFQSLQVDVTVDGLEAVYGGRIEALLDQDGDQYLLRSAVLEPLPPNREDGHIHVALRTACGTSMFQDTVVKAQQAL